MINRLKIELEQPEYSALLKMALDELRNPSDQARYILRLEFERRGLLPLQDAARPQEPALPIPEGAHGTY